MVPVAFHNTKSILPKNSWVYCFKTEVLIRVMPPIDVKEDPKETAAEARQRVAEVLETELRSAA